MSSDAPTTAAAPRPEPRSAAPKRRVPFWDNARFACIVLVVMGHATQRLTSDSNNAYWVYLFIYGFHMPAFAIISGYFSKAEPPSLRQMRRVITDILVPYIVMQAIWSLVQFVFEGNRSVNLTEPHWTLWFLLALGIFRLVLPYLAMLRWPLLWATVFSIGIGYAANVDSTFSLSRAIGLMPFFLLGWRLKSWGFMDRWQSAPSRIVWPARALAAGLFAAWAAVALIWVEDFKKFQLHLWFFYDDSFSDLGEPQWWAGLLRLGLILLAVVLSAAFLVLIPRRETWFTAFGQATMYVYLLHSFVLYPLRETGVLKDQHSSAMWLVSVLLAATAIAIFLSSPLVRKVFRPLVEPRPRWLFREIDDRPVRESRTDPTGSRRR
jgi:fucose 4-O-acetylase-like acetyltransferase